jgi:ZIP family zinc transporter
MILEAALWCLIAASTLIIGTWIAFTFRLSSKIVGIVMGFGAGALIAAVAYELFPETSRDLLSFIALGLGAIVFYFGTSWIERRSMAKGKEGEGAQAQTGKTIVLGALLDGIPESLVLGMTFAIGGVISIAFFGAILVANLPESIAASSVMERRGMPRRKIYKLKKVTPKSIIR